MRKAPTHSANVYLVAYRSHAHCQMRSMSRDYSQLSPAKTQTKAPPGLADRGCNVCDYLVRVPMAMPVAMSVVDGIGGLVHDRGLGGQDHPGDRRRVEHCGPRDLDRGDDAVGEQG